MQAARIDIADTQASVARQSQLAAVRNRGKQIEQRRIVDDELLLSVSIKTVCLQSGRSANQIIENTGASANHSLRLTLLGKPRRPGERHSGRKQKRAA